MIVKQFTRTILREVLLIDNIITLHYFDYVKKFFGQCESHDFWEMVYADCGSIDVLAGEQVFTLSQGEAIFHKPNEKHNVVSHGDFASSFIITYESRSPDIDFFNNRRVTLKKNERDLITQILTEGKKAFDGALDIMDQTKLIRRIDADFGSEQMVKILLESLLISVIRNNRENDLQSNFTKNSSLKNNDQLLANEIVNLLKKNLYTNINLSMVCEKMSLSKSYVEKIFKKTIGYGVMGYYNLLRVDEAKRLISEEQYNFTQIANLLHFGSIHYFSRIFKQITHMSPSEYAKSVKARALL